MHTLLKHIGLLLVILIIAALLRFIFLDRIPTGIGGDELEYILNAKAYFLTGKDLSGTLSLFSVFLFQYPPGILPQAELPYFLTVPFLPLSLFTARVVFASFSVLTILAIYLLAKELFSKPVSLLAAGLAAVNPWMIFIGRTAYEATPAMFFYLIGIWCLLIFKGKRIFFSLPFFLLGFYSYIGTKVIFAPIIISVCLFVYYREKKKYKKEYVLMSLFSIFFTIAFLFLSQDGSRTSEILTPFSPSISDEINMIRKNSIPTFLTPFLENKFTLYVKIIIDKFLSTISFQYLFVNGDDFFAQWRHGLFYPIESLFLIIGSFFLAVKERRIFVFISVLLGISIIPQLIHTQRSYFTPHITFFIPLLLVVMAYGLFHILNIFKKYKFGLIWISILGFIYLYSVLSFINQYFTQYPLKAHLDFPTRIVSTYSHFSSQDQQVIVFTSRPLDMYKKYLFYSDQLTLSHMPQVRESLLTKEYNFYNIKFLSCGDLQKREYPNSVVITDTNCRGNASSSATLRVSQLTDGGELYTIQGDKRCGKFHLKQFPQDITFSSLQIENLTEEHFCETYIVSI